MGCLPHGTPRNVKSSKIRTSLTLANLYNFLSAVRNENKEIKIEIKTKFLFQREMKIRFDNKSKEIKIKIKSKFLFSREIEIRCDNKNKEIKIKIKSKFLF